MNPMGLISAVQPVLDVFEKLHIAYYIGGSVASSAYGLARATMDIDIVADMNRVQIEAFYEALKSDYYLDQDTIHEAIQRKSSFNMIHLGTAWKIDVFILETTRFARMVMSRRQEDVIESDRSLKIFFATPEDVILTKLIWFDKGGQVSEKQMNDIEGILKVQKNTLNLEYMRNWSEKLGIGELLETALLSI